MTIPFSEASKVAPSYLVELYELKLFAEIHGISEIRRYHSGINAKGTGNLVWQGNQFDAWPVEVDGFKEGTGTLPEPTLRIGNVFMTISALIQTLPNGLEGAELTRIRTFARYLDPVNFPGNVNPTYDPTQEFPRETFVINQLVSESRQSVEFKLKSALGLDGVNIGRQILPFCNWTELDQCPYVLQCDKRLGSCENFYGNGRLQFGGFPSAGRFTR